MIVNDFDFRGILAANKLPEFRDHGPGPQGRRDNPDRMGTSAPGKRTRGATALYFGFELRIHAKTVSAFWQRGQL
jgi:hypothetical protein